MSTQVRLSRRTKYWLEKLEVVPLTQYPSTPELAACRLPSECAPSSATVCGSEVPRRAKSALAPLVPLVPLQVTDAGARRVSAPLHSAASTRPARKGSTSGHAGRSMPNEAR